MKAKTIAYICNHKDGRVKFFMEEPASPMWESSELVLRHEAQAEIDALKAENAALHAECGRLTRYLGKVPAKEAEAAYDQVDRYLRNSLDDSEYADMSAALEHCYRTLLSPQKVLSAEEVTESGFYWHRYGTEEWCVVDVDYGYHGNLFICVNDEQDDALEGQFLGPIKMLEVQE